MSIDKANSWQPAEKSFPENLESSTPTDRLAGPFLGESQQIHNALVAVQKRMPPVWPLKDYVAVNPYAGIADQKFLAARESLRQVSDLETLMDFDYYREQYASGHFQKSDINEALDEMISDNVTGAERLDVNQVLSFVQATSNDTELTGRTEPSGNTESANDRVLRTFAETYDAYHDTHWNEVIVEEISRHCATHYDQGQSLWASPTTDLPLYDAWRAAAQHDRGYELRGVSQFRKLVTRLPQEAETAVVVLLQHLNVPTDLWADYLLAEALTMPGWSAWAKYQQREAENQGQSCSDFAALLAIRLAYEVALSKHSAFEVNYCSTGLSGRDTDGNDEHLCRFALLKAMEIAYRKQLLSGLQYTSATPSTAKRRLAQMVFCIDVRSERLRRHLETTTDEIETFGFAGFFGVPMEYVPLGETTGSANVPVLITPQFKVVEEVNSADASANESAVNKRSKLRFLRKTWKEFQSSAASCFSFVETMGVFYGFKLVANTLGFASKTSSRYDGVRAADKERLGPSLRGLSEQGVTTNQQVDLAESILRGSGIVSDFARLIVLCGHGSQTENNPLQAGLDCGACGGHAGDANARFAAKLLNQSFVRQALAERGLEIPGDTHFVAGFHNTTTDDVQLFDVREIPESHHGDVEKLRRTTSQASHLTRIERLRVLPGPGESDLRRRSIDWSEIRPEWGLAGNAAFIAAPRQLTQSLSLDGRSFLHSYDHRNDEGFAILEQIMTAPMVVAHWINMQYYASTVDPKHFGSGNKAVHNVVGGFGIFSGNGGDLQTGLPWQSVHDGDNYQHHPLRLMVVLAAPRSAIEAIIEKHETVRDLVINGWLQLVAIDQQTTYRYSERQIWEELYLESVTPVAVGS